ncbi:MAG: hypothetical protein A2051_07740 [Desulfovibrionales bacterium GWA2_65_9]|nr:MAG: hypothetical protein A2051_07740 [Desulfovibrionales bacterium GWA2_65_9]
MRLADLHCIVTGGAGFIGSHLVEGLLAAGGSVLVVDDFSSGNRKNLIKFLDHPCLDIAEADIRDEQRMRELFAGAHCVFHLACRNVRTSLRQPTQVHDVNATGTLNTLKAAAAGGVQRYLYVSSSEVNGTADLAPMPEDYHFRPETIYGASKLTGEYYTQVFHRAGWLETVIVRPHNAYGPREHYTGILGEVIPRFILKALAGQPLLIYGDGSQTRDFTYVAETAAYLLRIMQNDNASGGTFNLCRGQEVSIREIAEFVLEITRSVSPLEHLPDRPSDVRRLYGDPSRLRALLGDSPSVSIREGLKRTVDWFRANVPLDQAVLDSMRSENWREAAREPWLEAFSTTPKGRA